MKEAILFIQITVSVALIGFILVQVKGTGFGRVWGGSASFTRRGLERLIFKLTFVTTFVLIGISILALAV